jgi:hypothetical protein
VIAASIPAAAASEAEALIADLQAKGPPILPYDRDAARLERERRARLRERVVALVALGLEEERRERPPAPLRDMTRVPIDGRYVYATAIPLEVGDYVTLPDSGNGSWVGVVTALGGDYPGPLRWVVRRVDPEQRDAPRP